MTPSDARQHMVDCQLLPAGIYNEHIIAVMGAVPREVFLPEDLAHVAYLDEDVSYASGRVLMEPQIFGLMLQALAPQPEEVVLDIGGGTGYSAAVFSHFVQTVIALEEGNDALREAALKNWHELELFNISEEQGAVTAGLPDNAPYDMIFLGGAVSEIPRALVKQLHPKTGRMAVVVRSNAHAPGQAYLVKPQDDIEDGDFSCHPLFDANVPYLKEFEPKESFAFA